MGDSLIVDGADLAAVASKVRSLAAGVNTSRTYEVDASGGVNVDSAAGQAEAWRRAAVACVLADLDEWASALDAASETFTQADNAHGRAAANATVGPYSRRAV